MSTFSRPQTSLKFTGIKRKNAFLAFFLFLFAFLATPNPSSSGETGALKLESISFSLGNKFRNRTWAPVVSTLANDSDTEEEVTLSLTVLQQGESANRVTYSRTVRLPARSSRELVLDVLVDTDTESILNCFRDKVSGELTPKVEELIFPDGKTIKHLFYRAVQPFIIKAELFQQSSGNLVAQNEIFCHPSFPGTLNVYSVAAYADPLPILAQRTIDGMEVIYGEASEDLDVKEDDYSFSAQNTPDAEHLAGRSVSRSMTQAHSLPRKWAAYHGVDVIVLSSPRGFDGRLGLDPLQQSSLLQWIWSGGKVVLQPSSDPAAYQHPFFEKLLPVRSLHNRPFLQETILTTAFGGKIEASPFHPGSTVEALPGRMKPVTENRSFVGLANRNIGHGSVWFNYLHSDAMQSWSQNLLIWKQILTPHSDPVPGLDLSLSEEVPTLMQEIVGIRAPNRSFVILLLGSYCLISTCLLIFLRRKGRAEWGWPLIILLAVTATGLAKTESDSTRQKTGFVQGELGVSVLGNRSGVASAYSFVSIFSPKHFSTDATFLNPYTLATGYTPPQNGDRRQGYLSSLLVNEGDFFTFPGLRINGGELFTCRALTLANYQEGIDLRLSFQGNPEGKSQGLSGTIENRTGEDLHDCFIALNRSVLQIGRLANGETRDLSSCTLSHSGRLASLDIVNDNEGLMRSRTVALVRRSARSLGPTQEGGQSREYGWPVTFYGWGRTPQALVSLGTDREPDQRAVQLLCLPVDSLSPSPHQATYTLPAGLCTISMKDSMSQRLYGDPLPGHLDFDMNPVRSGKMPPADQRREGSASRREMKFAPTGWQEMNGPGSLKLAFSLPSLLKGFIPAKAWIRCEISNPKYVPALSLLDYRAEAKGASGNEAWIPQPLNGQMRIPITDLSRFFGPNGELPQVRLYVNQPDAQLQAGGFNSLQSWKISVLELELTGTLPIQEADRRSAGNAQTTTTGIQLPQGQ